MARGTQRQHSFMDALFMQVDRHLEINHLKAPSSVQLKIPGRNYGVPSALTTEEIQEIIKKFSFVAKIARETGFTGIQIHSAHGYLLRIFIS